MCSHRHIILNKVYPQLQGENVYAEKQEMRYSYSASARGKGCSESLWAAEIAPNWRGKTGFLER